MKSYDFGKQTGRTSAMVKKGKRHSSDRRPASQPSTLHSGFRIRRWLLIAVVLAGFVTPRIIAEAGHCDGKADKRHHIAPHLLFDCCIRIHTIKRPSQSWVYFVLASTGSQSPSPPWRRSQTNQATIRIPAAAMLARNMK